MKCKLQFRTSLFVLLVCAMSFMLSHLNPAWATDKAFEADLAKNNQYKGDNWMSGIADGRYLHEINIPGAHDACTKRVQAAHGYTNLNSDSAITQEHTITEMLNYGVRMLDLRFTNCNRNVENPVTGMLYLCHGEYHKQDIKITTIEVDGLFYCYNEKKQLITIDNLFDEIKTWLDQHPSETVLLDITSEFDDSEKDKTLTPVYKLLRERVNQCSWIYKGREIPKLGDVRGKGVLISGHADDMQGGLNVATNNGSSTRQCNGTGFSYENHYDSGPNDKKNAVIGFYETHTDNLKKELSQSVSDCPLYYVFTSANRWKLIGGDTPEAIAKAVNCALYNSTDGLFLKRNGRKWGWVYSDFMADSITKTHQSRADRVWLSNFPDYNLSGCADYYYTVTFQDEEGKELGVQHVLKGASMVLPSPTTKGCKAWANVKNPDEIFQGKINVKEDLVLKPQGALSWEEFQTWVNKHQGKEATYTLTKDLIASAKDSAIVLPENTTISIKLEGHKIVAPSDKSAFIISNQGSRLNITGGTITGGSNVVNNAAAITIEKKNTVSLDDVKITGSSCLYGAGAIRVAGSATLILKDTEITGNTGYAGAVWLMSGSNMTVSGHTKIHGNSGQSFTQRVAGDVMINDGVRIEFADKLADDAQINIAVEHPDKALSFTREFGKWHDKAPSTYFKCMNPNFDIGVKYENGQMEGTVTNHKHDFEVTADENRLILKCKNESCSLHEHPVTAVLCKPKHSVYGDGLDPEATCISMTSDWKDYANPVFTYYEGTTKLDSAPINAGSYTVHMSKNGVTATINYTINPRPVSITGITAEDKTWDGEKDATLSYDNVQIDGLVGEDKLMVSVTGTFESADAGDNKTVRLSNYNLTADTGTILGNYTLVGGTQQALTSATIKKAAQDAPGAAPEVEKCANHSIVLTKTENYQYRCDNGEWQDSNVFTGLATNTKYSFYQRKKGNTNQEPSDPSTAIEATTTNYTWLYSVNKTDNTIRADCVEGSNTGTVTIGLTAPTLTQYGQTGTNKNATVTISSISVVDYSDFLDYVDVDYYTAVKDPNGSISGTGDIKYKKVEELDDAPSDGGDYVAEIQLQNVDLTTDGQNAAGKGDVSIAVGYTIAPASGTIGFKYSTLDMKCGDEDFINPLTNTGNGIVSYESSASSVAKVDEDGMVTIKRAGTTTITATASDTSNYIYSAPTATFTLRISKADASVLTAPAAKNSVYNGENQALVTSGSVSDGLKILYAKGEYSDAAPTVGWSEDIPSGKNTGTYHVWFKVSPDDNNTDNYNESTPRCVECSIVPVDKTMLEWEIYDAWDLYYSIKDDPDCSELADSLYDAITDAVYFRQSDDVTQEDVDDMISDLVMEELSAQAYKTDLDDESAAYAVECAIEAIGTVSNTQECKDKIRAARKAYDALDDDQKALVSKAGTLAQAEKKFEELKKQEEKEKQENQKKQSLADAKAQAKANVDAFDPGRYVATDQEKVNLAKTTALSAIAAASSVEAVTEAMTTFNNVIQGCMIQEPVTISKTPVKVKAKAKKNKVTVSWKKIAKNKKGKALLKQITGIQIQCSTDPEFKENVYTKTVGKKKTKAKFKLKRKKIYYIRVRYVGTDGVSKWSKRRRVKTK